MKGVVAPFASALARTLETEVIASAACKIIHETLHIFKNVKYTIQLLPEND